MDLLNSIGNTPLINLEKNLYAKLESLNPGGSIKDRPIKYIIEWAEGKGLIRPGDVIVEASSGNTGIALAMIGAAKNYKIKIIMPQNMSEERKKIISGFGAELILVGDGDFDGAIRMRDELCRDHGWFTTNQFHNKLNIECHRYQLGSEIVSECMMRGMFPKLFICGTGTGGTLMGVGSAIKSSFPSSEVWAVEPMESPVMAGGQPGLHGIQGIGDGSKFLVDLNFINGIVHVSTEEAIKEAKFLAQSTGNFVGISAGANSLGAKKWLATQSLKEDEVAITILCDRGERYLSMF
jgi:cysteine synthase A